MPTIAEIQVEQRKEGSAARVIGRNGTWPITAVELFYWPVGGLVDLVPIGKRGTRIRGGLRLLSVEEMDAICAAWAAHRAPVPEDSPDTDRLYVMVNMSGPTLFLENVVGYAIVSDNCIAYTEPDWVKTVLEMHRADNPDDDIRLFELVEVADVEGSKGDSDA